MILLLHTFGFILAVSINFTLTARMKPRALLLCKTHSYLNKSIMLTRSPNSYSNNRFTGDCRNSTTHFNRFMIVHKGLPPRLHTGTCPQHFNFRKLKFRKNIRLPLVCHAPNQHYKSIFIAYELSPCNN